MEDGFGWFWATYPRRVGKSGTNGAEGAFKRALKHADAATILDGLRGWCAYWEREQTEQRFIPYPATWLNQRRWEDVPTIVREVGSWQRALAAARERDRR